MKEKDIFLSYSHLDCKFVKKIAEALQQRRIRVWYDGWEMKPGDVLRERINQGIEQADYFLVVLSENSLDSSWVRFELNSAMISEIEQRKVRVIPAIIGKIDFSQLPLDLRAKYCLDFRSNEDFSRSIDAITDLVQPERKRREELNARLRNPVNTDIQTILELKEHVLGHGDQSIHVAAIAGLEKLGGTEAVLTFTEKILGGWGVRGIKRAIKG